MPKQIQISIPNPCHEKWREMTPNQQGAFCKVCQKNVIDFTNKTENEIYEAMIASGASGCGRFRADQLEQPITKSEINKSFFNWKAIAAAIAAFVTTEKVMADRDNIPKIEKVICDTWSLPIIKDTVTKVAAKTDTANITPTGKEFKGDFVVITAGIYVANPTVPESKYYKTGKVALQKK